MSNVFISVSIETLVGSGNWFTQSVRCKSFNPLAFGQVEYSFQRAEINWLLLCHTEEKAALFDLVENLSFESGLRGSKYLLASATLDSEEFSLLRRQGFSIYGWENYWRVDVSQLPATLQKGTRWRRAISRDQHDILQFQRRFIAPAMRLVTPLADEILPDFILLDDNGVLGTAKVNFSSNRSVVHFMFDPRTQNPKESMRELIILQAPQYTDWYICQQAGQDWLEEHLQCLAQPALARRELLVKHFAIREKLPVGILNHTTDNSHPDPITPYIHSGKP